MSPPFDISDPYGGIYFIFYYLCAPQRVFIAFFPTIIDNQFLTTLSNIFIHMFKGLSSNYSRLSQLLALVVFFLMSSCVGRKDVDYFQLNEESGRTSDTTDVLKVFEPKIQANDILGIHVASINAEAASFFNPSERSDGTSGNDLTSYLVDLNGEIEMPLVGKVKVAGLSTREIRETLRGKLEKYLQNPTVRVYLESYKVTILGEVRLPGVYNVRNEKLSLTDAVGLAGDLTIYGDRKSVMVIREQDGKKIFTKLDLTTRDLFKSDLYYLRPGDIVYIPSGKGRIASADAFYRIAPIALSALTLFTLIAIRLNNN